MQLTPHIGIAVMDASYRTELACVELSELFLYVKKFTYCSKHHKNNNGVHTCTQTRGTYWGGWWHRAVWPPELQSWDHLRRAGPRGCMTACFHGCHKRTRALSACWCCSEWGSHCRRSLRAGSTCSSLAGWNPPSASGYWQCYLRKHADGQSLSKMGCLS